VNIREILGAVPVIPVLTFNDLTQAVPAARALVAGGLHTFEVNLRSSVAIGCIEAIRGAVPVAIVGAGNLTRPADFAAAGRAGALFGASPGLTPEIAAAARGARFPVLPGIMTPSEVISARHAGFDLVKLYPALQAGGVNTLRALAAAFPDMSFCPDGDVQSAASEYLALPSVICVFGSWIAPDTLLQSGSWSAIEALAREAASLHRG
jgi:2-dehydro-3-deoxyphosphogluconate aldolase/(4S)-4-hydroxy-2-oxoglutarate aldolase